MKRRGEALEESLCILTLFLMRDFFPLLSMQNLRCRKKGFNAVLNIFCFALICSDIILSVHCRTGSLETVHLVVQDVLTVHCRTGSLEMSAFASQLSPTVHCRTGSLEISTRLPIDNPEVHCRTGSLESRPRKASAPASVHCRTGSLEIHLKTVNTSP